MKIAIKRLFLQVITNSLNTQQVNYLGELLDSNFNLYTESGFRSSMPIPRQVAAQTLLDYFDDEEDITRLFSIMLNHEGQRFYNRDLAIWERNKFMSLLLKSKWIFDKELNAFLLDPFYEREINFLNKIRIIDLREEIDMDSIIKEIATASKNLSKKKLEWRVVLRLYDLERKSGELIRSIIDMLLTKQNLQKCTGELFVCLKELTINASKANYKRLFEKHVTRPQGVSSDGDYGHFLELFKKEIEENGNSSLIELARMDDRYINITFQSTLDAIEIWVTNNQNVSLIEKFQIMKKLGMMYSGEESFVEEDGDDDADSEDEYAEGAGLGLHLVQNILNQYTEEPVPLKVVFYPSFLKMGFTLSRDNLMAKIMEKESDQPSEG